MIKKTSLLFLLSLFTMKQIFTKSTAPQPWNTPRVPQEIIEMICFEPISHPNIKEKKSNDINNSRTDLIDLAKTENPRIKALALFDKKYKQTYSECSLVRKGLYDRLLTMLERLPSNIGIAYFEGLRPLYIQKKYFDTKYQELLKTISDKYQAYEETAKLVAPFIEFTPPHSTGGAIDMVPFKINNDQTTELLDMGKFGVIFGPNDQQETFSQNISLEQRSNRLLFLKAAIENELVNYGFEWWHFSYGDQIWAYKKNVAALYTSVTLDENKKIVFTTKEDYINSFQ